VRFAILLLLAVLTGQGVPYNLRQIIIQNSNHHTALPHSIPDFCQAPNFTATTSGNWSSAGTWDKGAVPGPGAKVLVNPSVTVTYDISSTTVLECVGVYGILTFSPSATTKLTVEDFMVYHGGELRIGTEGAPITGLASVVFDCYGTCLETGTVGSPGTDPEQFGVGLVAMGKVRMHGEAKTPFVRLAAGATASSSTLSLGSTPTNWDSGDEYYFPESKQRRYTESNGPVLGGSLVKWHDRGTLSANVTGASASLSAALSFDHPGGMQGNQSTADRFPHVANLTRNIVLSSANPSGTRAHTLYTGQADVDIRYVRFKDLGRTTTDDLHCTLFTDGDEQGVSDCTAGTGTLTQIGTNQKGRYAVHFHHLWGPGNSANTGYQYRFIGNAVVDSKKWPVTVHWTSYGLIQSNVIAEYQGPAIFLEQFHEHYNLFDSNFMAGAASNKKARGQESGGDSTSTGSGGREPGGIWARGGQNNYYTNNIAAGFWSTATPEILAEVGFKFHLAPSTPGPTTRIPRFRGADMTNAAHYTTADLQTLSFLQFEGNECYGMSTCMTIWHLGTDGYAIASATPASTITGLTAWNVYEQGFFGYPVYNYVFDGMVCRGLDDNFVIGSSGYYPMCWTSGDYKNNDITIRNMDAQGVAVGVGGTKGMDESLVFENSSTHTGYGAIEINGFNSPGSGHSPLGNRVHTIRNVTHTTMAGFTALTINMRFDPNSECCGGFFFADTLRHTTYVENYNGTTRDFYVYFDEQASQAYAGGLSPCSDTTTYPEINGIVCNSEPEPEALAVGQEAMLRRAVHGLLLPPFDLKASVRRVTQGAVTGGERRPHRTVFGVVQQQDKRGAQDAR
jgi:hypothetical protein